MCQKIEELADLKITNTNTRRSATRQGRRQIKRVLGQRFPEFESGFLNSGMFKRYFMNKENLKQGFLKVETRPK